jgi:tetratricopeptide (TPR) repeat protein
MRLRLLHAAVVALLLLTVAVDARAQSSEQAEVEKGRNAYRAQQFDEADARFRQMLDPKTGTVHDAVLVSEARMYWGASLVQLKKPAEADDVFHALLKSDRHFEPDPLEFPTNVVNAFIDTRSRVRDELERAEHEDALRAAERKKREEAERQYQIARLAMLEDMAKKEKVTETHSRFVALLPFGVGQFQNGQTTLGWLFLGVEAAFAVGGLAAVPFYLSDLRNAADSYNALQDKTVAQQYYDRANVARLVNLAFNGALALTAAVGILHAEITFVPAQTQYVPRPLPPVPQPPPPAKQAGLPFWFGGAPVFTPDGERATGATFDLGGRF